ncbi:MAG TPA: copper resistance protein CopC [Acidobacteriaceae bacterium]
MQLRMPHLIVAAALAVFAPAAALAHAHPKVMDPAPDSTVTAPRHISIEFSEALDPKFSSLRLTNGGGTVVSRVSSSVSTDDPKHMTLDLPALAPGVYIVRWVSVARDGHRLEGNYKFTAQ